MWKWRQKKDQNPLTTSDWWVLRGAAQALPWRVLTWICHWYKLGNKTVMSIVQYLSGLTGLCKTYYRMSGVRPKVRKGRKQDILMNQQRKRGIKGSVVCKQAASQTCLIESYTRWSAYPTLLTIPNFFFLFSLQSPSTLCVSAARCVSGKNGRRDLFLQVLNICVVLYEKLVIPIIVNPYLYDGYFVTAT